MNGVVDGDLTLVVGLMLTLQSLSAGMNLRFAYGAIEKTPQQTRIARIFSWFFVPFVVVNCLLGARLVSVLILWILLLCFPLGYGLTMLIEYVYRPKPDLNSEHSD